MAWDDDSELKRYNDFYFVADKEGNLILFNSIKTAEAFGRKVCEYFRIDSWHNYMTGDSSVNVSKLKLKI